MSVHCLYPATDIDTDIDISNIAESPQIHPHAFLDSAGHIKYRKSHAAKGHLTHLPAICLAMAWGSSWGDCNDQEHPTPFPLTPDFQTLSDFTLD